MFWVVTCGGPVAVLGLLIAHWRISERERAAG
jgi:hypothetical protein